VIGASILSLVRDARATGVADVAVDALLTIGYSRDRAERACLTGDRRRRHALERFLDAALAYHRVAPCSSPGAFSLVLWDQDAIDEQIEVLRAWSKRRALRLSKSEGGCWSAYDDKFVEIARVHFSGNAS